MNMYTMPIFLLVPLTGMCTSINAQMRDSTIEPPLRYDLKINGKNYRFQNGHPKKLSGEFKDPKLEVTIHPTRLFWHEGISFEYDRRYSFQYSHIVKNEKTWLLMPPGESGFSIFVYEFEEEISLDDLIRKEGDEMFERANYKVKNNPSLKVKNRTLKCKAIHASVDGDKSMIEYIALPAPKGSRFIVLNDLLMKGDSHSKQFTAAKKLFNASLAVK